MRFEIDLLASALRAICLLPLRTRYLSIHDLYAAFLDEVNNSENPECTRNSTDNEIRKQEIVIELERTRLARMALVRDLFLGTIEKLGFLGGSKGN